MFASFFAALAIALQGPVFHDAVTVVPISYVTSQSVVIRLKSAKLPGVQVTEDARTNRVIIRADAAGTRSARDLIATIDKDGDFKLFIVKHRDAQSLATQLPDQGKGIEKMVVDPTANSIIVIGTSAAVKAFGERIEALDR